MTRLVVEERKEQWHGKGGRQRGGLVAEIPMQGNNQRARKLRGWGGWRALVVHLMIKTYRKKSKRLGWPVDEGGELGGRTGGKKRGKIDSWGRGSKNRSKLVE